MVNYDKVRPEGNRIAGSAGKAGILAYNGEEAVKVGKGLFAIPLGMLLS